MSESLDRRSFLRQGTMAGIGAAIGGSLLSGCSKSYTGPSSKPVLFASQPREVVKIGLVGIGNMGSSHLINLLGVPGCEIAAVCDIRPERTDWAKKRIVDAGFPEPKVYGKDEFDFVRMCEKEQLDLVYNSAPWEYHTPICMAAMENGKHAASEVNIALTIEDCWKLVETSEKYKLHCIMQENCCYDKMEMAVMNMVRKGLFGKVVHGECGYMHDLRGLMASKTYYQGMWRWHEHLKRPGNLYPTHGIGPMAWCMDINRGDAFDYLVNFSSMEAGLSEYIEEKHPDRTDLLGKEITNGDVNITLIRTKMGRTIICKHDVHLPRPYTRIFMVQGTKGIVRKYPESKIHIEGKSPAHSWEKFGNYMNEYEHDLWKHLREMTAKTGKKGMGHGGMDYIEDYRLVNAIKNGYEPDIDVYDSAAWSALIPLSAESIKTNQVVKFPDFTRGMWKEKRELGIYKNPNNL